MKKKLLIAITPVNMSNQIHPVFYFHFKTWIFILVEIPNDVHRWYSRFLFGIKVWLYLVKKFLVSDLCDFTILLA